MAGADVTSAAARAHCLSSQAVVINPRGPRVAAAWLEREVRRSVELEDALLNDVGRDAAVFEVILGGGQVFGLHPGRDGVLTRPGQREAPWPLGRHASRANSCSR